MSFGDERVTRFALEIPVDGVRLAADLALPEKPSGLVVFAHGSGSSRRSARNRYVAEHMARAGLATLLLDLLSADEEEQDAVTGRWRFDIPLLARRLSLATRWIREYHAARGLPVGYFGASTGAAAALIAAAEFGREVAAVVSRGGRTDLARSAACEVAAPTLLIVGGADQAVLAWNRETLGQLRCEKSLAVIPDATHLFEEPGALGEVARLACEWFVQAFAMQSADEHRAPVTLAPTPAC